MSVMIRLGGRLSSRCPSPHLKVSITRPASHGHYSSILHLSFNQPLLERIGAEAGQRWAVETDGTIVRIFRSDTPPTYTLKSPRDHCTALTLSVSLSRIAYHAARVKATASPKVSFEDLDGTTAVLAVLPGEVARSIAAARKEVNR